MTGVRTNIVTTVEMSGGHSNDTNYFRPTLATTAQSFQIREVLADKAYSSKANLRAVDDLERCPTSPSGATLPSAKVLLRNSPP